MGYGITVCVQQLSLNLFEQVDAVLDTLCCAGTCYRQQEILGLGYTDVCYQFYYMENLN